MRIATTTADFAAYCPKDTDRIRQLHRAGFRYIDLSLYDMKPDSPYMQENWQTQVLELKAVADALGMRFVQAHSPGGNPLSEDPDQVDFLVRATIRSIEICAILGITNTVSHPGKLPNLSKEEWFVRNKAYYEKLFPAMQRWGVNVLCENSCDANAPGKYCANSGKDMREFIDYVNHPLFHGCWDTGHANCEGSQYDDILALGEHLYAIHYNDNHGEKDDHLAPFFGRLNHDEILNALVDVGFRGYFTLECFWTLIRYNQITGKRRRFDRDDKPARLREPQLFMQQHMEALLYDTAKWMLEQYDLFRE